MKKQIMLLETNNNIRMLLKTNILKEIIQIKGEKNPCNVKFEVEILT